MPINQSQPNVPGVDTSATSPTMIVHPEVLADTSDNAFGILGNPIITSEQIRSYIQAGKSFSTTSGKQTAAGAITAGFSLFNPNASGKTIALYSLKQMVGNTCYNLLNLIATDVVSWTANTITNKYAGSATASVATSNFVNTNQASPAGTTIDIGAGSSNVAFQQFSSPDMLFLPAGNGCVLYVNVTGANVWVVSAQWIEF